MKKILVAILAILLMSTYAETAVYKYVDESGKVVFTDKKPIDKESQEVEIKAKDKVRIKPKFYIDNEEGQFNLVVDNPYYAPIEVKVKFKEKHDPIHTVVEPNEVRILASFDQQFKSKYQWIMGAPNARHAGYKYRFPVKAPGRFKISQGFGGSFSHTREPNVYSIDIAMPVGTYLVAAREGVVISVKDDYHMAGRDSFFLDKANYVKILHDDGTYAIYAHILLGAALVKPGDKVVAGQEIARSGSSGYSTGPHLHFVIRKNVGLKSKSVRFTMYDASGKEISLKRGTIVKT